MKTEAKIQWRKLKKGERCKEFKEELRESTAETVRQTAKKVLGSREERDLVVERAVTEII